MADMTWGSAYTYYSGTQAVYQNSCCIDTDKFVFTYQDADDGNIYAIVGTISGTVISYGSAVVVGASTVGNGYNDVCKLDTDKVVVCYFDSSRYGQARVGTISGTTISFGAVSEFSGDLNYHSVRCCALSATKFFVAYKARPSGVYKGHGKIGTVSGTTISMGTVGVFYDGTSAPGACHKLSSTKAVLCYMVSNAYGVVVDCSGTTPSYGTALDISAGAVASYDSFAIDDLSSTKLVFSWNHNSTVADREGRVVILEVSNSTLSKGTYVTFYDYSSGVPDSSVVAFGTDAFVLVYCELSPSIDGSSRYCTVSGTTITLGSVEHWDDTHNFSNMEACLVDSYKMVMTTRRTVGATVEVGLVGTSAVVSGCTVTTDAATDITEGSATLNGTLDDDGGEACDCGFEWGEAEDALDNTTTTESKTISQTFSQGITGLKAITTYYFRAFATNSNGTCYGSVLNFTTLGEVYPSEATTRVTGLIHRWFPGTFTLEMNLGAVSTQFGLPSWTKEPLPPTPPDEPSPPPVGVPTEPYPTLVPCHEGDVITYQGCIWKCVGGMWEKVGYAQCKDGDYKIEGGIAYRCIDGQWVAFAGL